MISRSTKFILLANCALLLGCATSPQIPTVTRVPVPVSCIQGEPPAKPETRPEAEILAMDEFAATITVYYERLALRAYSEKASAIIEACK